jgi:ribosomal protein S27AE
MILSDADRRILTEARELATLRSASAVRQRFGATVASATTTGVAYIEAFRQAQHLLTELATLAERLAGETDTTIPACPQCGASELDATQTDAWRCLVCGQEWQTGSR